MMVKRFALVVLYFGVLLIVPPPAGPAAGKVRAAGGCDWVTQIPEEECEALVALYKSTNGPKWFYDRDWLVTNTPCDWYGVTCDDGHVTELDLRGSNLSGSIPPGMENLANLQELHLDNNLLSSIPPELGNLANLQILDLHDNRLTGSIPLELGNLANLEWLDLSANPLSGSIPPELGNLANLQTLYLYDTPLSGALPRSLIALVLDRFDFSNTNLCEPGDAAFQAWLRSIPRLWRTSVICWWAWLPLVLKAG